MDITTDNASKNSPPVIVNDLTRAYGKRKAEFTAVDGISFAVHPGEVFGLLGTNGAGKTSTLELIEGLDQPSQGSIEVFGADPYADRDLVRPRMGIMLQSGGLPSALTVKETATMWAGTCAAPCDVEEVLNEVGLTHRMDVKVGSLSGGEQRRLDLACALLGDPDLLILDEPTTGLDPESRNRVWELLAGLKRKGVTMMLTTHYLGEAEALCDRLAIMHRGHIAAEGTLSELTARGAAEITFSSAITPPSLPGTRIDSDGEAHTITTDHLQGYSLEILTWAHKEGLDLEGFAAHPATLEKVFLSIAGQEAQSV